MKEVGRVTKNKGDLQLHRNLFLVTLTGSIRQKVVLQLFLHINSIEEVKEMGELKNLLVGFDLCNDFSQISCFSYKTYEPESICPTSDKNKYIIPTVLGVKAGSKEWVYGEEALALSEGETGVLIKDLVKRAEKGEETEIYGVQFTPVLLLEKFFRKSLQLLKIYYPGNSILKLVVTLRELNESLRETVYAALENLGIGKDRAFIQNHAQSYQYYALSQPRELWINDVVLFEYDEEGLIYQQITINRKVKPYLVGIQKKDMSEVMKLETLDELGDTDKLAFMFGGLARKALHKQIVSTIYITGKGFDRSWADPVLKELCVGRRVFKGQNLFTKGACYAAKELSGERKLEEFLILDGDMITGSFYIEGYYDAKTAEAVMARAATPWYEIDEKMDLLLDDTNQVILYYKDLLKHEITEFSICLEGLPNRPNKTTRVEVRLKFYGKSAAVLTVKDKGFGNFFPSTNRIWEKEIHLHEDLK